jgi:hypothetical protein
VVLIRRLVDRARFHGLQTRFRDTKDFSCPDSGMHLRGAWVNRTLADCLGVFPYYLQLPESPRLQNASDSAELAIYYKLQCR